MLIITNLKEGDNIEKGLKIYKNKIKKINLIKNYKSKEFYLKPSIKRRLLRKKKKYLIQKKLNLYA